MSSPDRHYQPGNQRNPQPSALPNYVRGDTPARHAQQSTPQFGYQHPVSRPHPPAGSTTLPTDAQIPPQRVYPKPDVTQPPQQVPTEKQLAPSKQRHIVRNGASGLGGLFVLLIIVGNLGSNASKASTTGPDLPAAPAPTAAADPATATFTAGTYSVGSDLLAGTYRTAGPSDGIGCGWSRLKGTSGELSDIIANDIVQGPGVFTVKATDNAVELVGSCSWTKVK